MPQPLPGMRTVAEYGTRFDADLAVARLVGYGIEASVWSDPMLAVAHAYSSDRLYAVVVREEIYDDAMDVMADGTDDEADDMDRAFHAHRFQDRPAWVRRTTVLLLASFAGPPLIAACYFAWKLLTALGP